MNLIFRVRSITKKKVSFKTQEEMFRRDSTSSCSSSDDCLNCVEELNNSVLDKLETELGATRDGYALYQHLISAGSFDTRPRQDAIAEQLANVHEVAYSRTSSKRVLPAIGSSAALPTRAAAREALRPSTANQEATPWAVPGAVLL